METGRRAWQCELSTVDSAFLLAGVLAAAAYFDRDEADEQEVRMLADALWQDGPELDAKIGPQVVNIAREFM
jgi:hypothetical protein